MNAEQWYKNLSTKTKKSPFYKAETALFNLEEEICKIGDQPKGLYKILFWLLEWFANLLIYRKTSPNQPLDSDTKSSGD